MLSQASLVVRVNYDKLDVLLRNRRLVELAESELNPVTSHVYECLLSRVEYKTAHCRPAEEVPREGEEMETYSYAIPLTSVAADVDPQIDYAGSIGPMRVPRTKPQNNRCGKRLKSEGRNGVNSINGHVYDEDFDGGEEEEDGEEDMINSILPTTLTDQVDQHLALLQQPPYFFAARREINGLTNWAIEFRHLARKLRNLEIETMVESRYGDVALRILRVLHAKGKLDEKRLQEISLLPFKDLRQVLASMQTGGFVDLQEVPRDATRQPSRTIFLWSYGPDRVVSAVLEDVYKAMSRSLQRLKFERFRLKDFLDKAERSDVKGNEELYLSEAELSMLEHWKAKEALLLGEVARLDDLVAVFRDF